MALDFASIAARLQTRFGGKITNVQSENVDPWIEVEPAAWREVAELLKNDPELKFDHLSCLSGVDFCEAPGRKGKKPTWTPHIEVVYHFYSYAHKHRLACKVLLPRWRDEQAGQLPEVASVADLWRTADWHEREAFDLVGVRFVGHPDLRRILCAEDWEGHPLRKDYEMPLEYHGMRGR